MTVPLLKSWLILFGCLAAGETFHLIASIHVSGAVIGMAILVATLVATGGPSEPFEHTASTLLRHLPLLFVPAGVGVIQHLTMIRSQILPIVIALPLSTAFAMAIAAVVVERMTMHVPLRKRVLQMEEK
jgi:holin-like protein